MAAIDDYMATQCSDLSEGTLDDYHYRAKWLLRTLGPHRKLREITFDTLEDLGRAYGPGGKGMLYATVEQRLKFLRWCMLLAAKRKVISKDDIPEMPKFPRDVVHKKPVPSISEHREWRLSIPPGRFRWLADFFFWTGHHNIDAWKLAWWMLDPEYVWRDYDGTEFARGRYWRCTTKNRRCEPFWFPMEPEFRAAVLELFASNEDRRAEELVTGRVWNLKRTFDAASDRAGLPRFTPIRLRAAFCRIIRARRGLEYQRLAMGHESGDSQLADDRKPARRADPTTAESHYLGPSVDVFIESFRALRLPSTT